MSNGLRDVGITWLEKEKGRKDIWWTQWQPGAALKQYPRVSGPLLQKDGAPPLQQSQKKWLQWPQFGSGPARSWPHFLMYCNCHVEAENHYASTVELRPEAKFCMLVASEHRHWLQHLMFHNNHWLLKQGNSEMPLWLWSQLTALHHNIHTKNKSGRMGLKNGNSATNQQNVTGSCCLFLAIWQHIRYLWCKL